MRDYKKHKLKFSPYLEKLYQSDKPMIIYKFGNKYKVFTDFSKKIILNKSNIKSFLSSFSKKEYKKEQDLFIGFFGYEILCNLLNIRLKNQKKTNPYNNPKYFVPKICATIPLVAGTVDSHKIPKLAPKKIEPKVLGGKKINKHIETPLKK